MKEPIFASLLSEYVDVERDVHKCRGELIEEIAEHMYNTDLKIKELKEKLNYCEVGYHNMRRIKTKLSSNSLDMDGASLDLLELSRTPFGLDLVGKMEQVR